MPSALIIGGGPAGSTAAILLARSRWHVTLIEQHRFPRDKVCGECLSPIGIEVLRRLDLAERFVPHHPVQLDRVALHPIDGPSVILPLPQPMWGLSRRTMDDVLLNAARDAGANILQPARCESMTPGPRPSITVRDLVSNRTSTRDARYLLVADGKGLLPGSRPTPTGEFGIQAHFKLDGPPNTIELFGFQDHYGGISPLEDGTWNLAIVIPPARLSASRGNPDRILSILRAENSTLAHRLRHAKQVRPWLTTPLPRFHIQPNWPANVIPIGNAAAAIEPIGGEGMSLALRSAELAAHALISTAPISAPIGAPASPPTIGAAASAATVHLPPETDRHNNDPLAYLPRQFHHLWNRRARASRLAGLAASNPPIAEAITSLLAHNRPLQHAVTYLMGKGTDQEVLY